MSPVLDGNVIIPIKGGITEGGAIIIVITLGIVALIVFAMFILIRYGRRFSAWLAEIRADAKDTKESTVNSHGPNMRDDLDRKHDEVREDIRLMFVNMGERFDTANRRMDGFDRRLSGIDDRLNERSNA